MKRPPALAVMGLAAAALVAVTAALLVRRDGPETSSDVADSNTRVAAGGPVQPVVSNETAPTQDSASTRSDAPTRDVVPLAGDATTGSLDQVAILEGSVLDALTGDPVGDVMITLTYEVDPLSQVVGENGSTKSHFERPKGVVRMPPLPRPVVTDSVGHFSIEGVPVRDDLNASLQAVLEVGSMVSLKKIQPGTNTRVFRLERSEVIDGLVLDAATRRPATTGVVLSIFSSRFGDWQPVGEPDSNGRFRARGPSSTFSQIGVRAQRESGFGSSIVFKQTARPATHEAVLFVGDSCVLEGSCVDQAGRGAIVKLSLHHKGDPLKSICASLGIVPVYGLEIYIDEPSAVKEEVWSDTTGKYSFDRLLPMEYDTITVQSGRGWEVTEKGPSFERGGQRIVLDLQPPAYAGVIRGHVRLNGASTEAKISWRGAKIQGNATVKSDGAFELAGVEPGTVELEVTSRPVAVMESRKIVVKPPETSVADFDLAAELTKLSGRVVDRSGAPASGVLVECSRPGVSNAVTYRATTDADGRFTLSPVEPGADYAIVLSVKGAAVGGGGNYRAGSSNLEFKVNP